MGWNRPPDGNRRQLFQRDIIAVHNRVDSTLSSTSTRRRTHGTPSIGFCQRLLFVGCAHLRCRRKPTHYNMVSKLVTGVIAELKGQMRSRQQWRMIRGCALMCIPHLAFIDCRSLADHLAAEILARVQDNRLGIELMAISDDVWRDGQKTWNSMKNGGDCLEWISAATMISDCPTIMKPDFILKVLKENVYRVQKQKPKR